MPELPSPQQNAQVRLIGVATDSLMDLMLKAIFSKTCERPEVQEAIAAASVNLAPHIVEVISNI